MTRIAIVVATSFVLVGLWLHESSSAQTGANPRRNEPPPTQQPLPEQQRSRRDDKAVGTVNHIPSFMQAGRSYVFEPVGRERFSGRVVSLDATGWVQVQLRPGPDVGPLAEWFNLANMASVKAMN